LPHLQTEDKILHPIKENAYMPTIQLFVTCLIDTLQPQIGESVVIVLERLGVKVEFPKDQTCCGQPAFNAGMRSEARKTAEHIIKVFENTSGPIIIPSGSCTAMIRHNYPEIFADDPHWLPRAQNIANRSYEFTEYIVDQLGVTDLDAYFPGKITYHPSCHLLRGLGVDHQPRTLLKNVIGAEVVDLPHQEECCGFGGVFSVNHPEISAEMLKCKITNIETSGAPTIVVCDTGCLINIAGGLSRAEKPQKVIHIAEVLAKNK
jgi:L-lactate dehydrogenase complex protein LldE